MNLFQLIITLFQGIFKRRYAHFIELQTLPERNVDFTFCNDSDDQGLLDPVSFDTITKQDLQSAKTFIIGQYALTLETVIKSIFRKPLLKTIIHHPIEAHYLTEEENQKIYKDLSHFFCLFQHRQIYNCWEISQTLLFIESYDMAKRFYGGFNWLRMNLVAKSQKVLYLSKQLIYNAYLNNFFALIPPESRRFLPPLEEATRQYEYLNVENSDFGEFDPRLVFNIPPALLELLY